MKKTTTFLIICICVLTMGANAQPFTITNADTYVNHYATNPNDGTSYTYLKSILHLTNNSGSTKNIQVKKTTISQPQGAYNNLCWGQFCDPPSVILSSDIVTLNNGQTDSSFLAKYYPEGQTSITTVEYCFFDTSAMSDSLCIRVIFDGSNLVSTEEIGSQKNRISNPFPLPAKDWVNLNYQINNNAQGVLFVRNLLGEVIKTISLNSNQSSVSIDVSELPSGLYLYTLAVNGTIAETKKMVVSH